MSPSIRPTALPLDVPLAGLAEVLHHHAADLDRPLIALVEFGADAATIAAWPVPPGIAHPVDVLVGYVAAPPSQAVGLTTAARARSLDETAGAPPVEVRITYVADRSGAVVSLIDDGDGVPRRLREAPVGWVPDVLARVLGRPTEPPATGPAACVEAIWVDRIAALALGHPGEVRTWEPVAALHPLAADGPPLPGPLLALQCEQLDATSSWASVRRAWTGHDQRHLPRPPGGVVVEPARWFDDGSFARWSQRHLVPAEVLLPAVLDALPGDVGRLLVESLVTVRVAAETPFSEGPTGG